MKNLLLFCFVLGVASLEAQINLVPNPSFEVYDTCPNSLGQTNYAIGWSSYSNTPDYFNSCSSVPVCSVPYNWPGYQEPLIGDAYAGFQAYVTTITPNYREIIGCRLSAPLVVGQKYFVNFKVVNAGLLNYNINVFDCCTNKIGARFSTIAYSQTHPTPINNFAQIYTDTIIKDTVNWHTIAGSFIADSSYQYFEIGNFFDDAHTDTMIFMSNYCRAYYLVDGVCVSTDSAYAATWTSVGEIVNDENNINVFPNPFVDYITIDFNTLTEPYNIEIDNILGEQVFSKQKIINPNEHIAISNIKGDILFVKIIYQNKQFNYKLIKI